MFVRVENDHGQFDVDERDPRITESHPRFDDTLRVLDRFPPSRLPRPGKPRINTRPTRATQETTSVVETPTEPAVTTPKE